MSKSHRQREFDKVMCVLSRAHSLFPELRIGQLILNALSSHHNPYYVSDEELFNCLKEYCNNVRK